MNKLRLAREEAGFTQDYMAKKLGISESYYSQLENGKRRLSLKVALEIASILNLTPNDLFLDNNMAKRKGEGLNTNSTSVSRRQQGLVRRGELNRKAVI